jgi:hypothetical protein
MPRVPLPDVEMGLAVLLLGFLGLLGLAGIVLLEGLVLRRLRWGGLRGAMLDSLLMNIASTVVGILLLWAGGDIAFAPGSLREAAVRLPLSWALSVIVEGGTLIAFRRKAAREVIRPVLLANLASYALVVALLAVALPRL